MTRRPAAGYSRIAEASSWAGGQDKAAPRSASQGHHHAAVHSRTAAPHHGPRSAPRHHPSQPPPPRGKLPLDANPTDPDSAGSTPHSTAHRKRAPGTPPSGLLLASLPEGFHLYSDSAAAGGTWTPEALETARSDCSTVATGVDSTRSRATCNNEAAILSIFEALGATVRTVRHPRVACPLCGRRLR